MPMLIKHIDKIAREKQHDVVCLHFKKEGMFCRGFDEEHSPEYLTITKWLDDNGYGYQKCAGCADTSSISGWPGLLYIDVPYDKNLPEYRKLEAFIEPLGTHQDGTTNWPDVAFYYLPLKMAMKNSFMDEPGYWDKRAEDF